MNLAATVGVRGSLTHPPLDQKELLSRLQRAFPQATIGGFEFIIRLQDCQVQLFSNSVHDLDFEISVTEEAGDLDTVAKSEMLVRAADVLWARLRRELRAVLKRGPRLRNCAVVDVRSRHQLLLREERSPLRTPGARLAYAFVIGYVLLTLGLVSWQMQDPVQQQARTGNILTIATSLGVAALGTLLPLLVNWVDWRRTPVWRYVRTA